MEGAWAQMLVRERDIVDIEKFTREIDKIKTEDQAQHVMARMFQEAINKVGLVLVHIYKCGVSGN